MEPLLVVLPSAGRRGDRCARGSSRQLNTFNIQFCCCLLHLLLLSLSSLHDTFLGQTPPSSVLLPTRCTSGPLG
jgi:hypothetical protein